MRRLLVAALLAATTLLPLQSAHAEAGTPDPLFLVQGAQIGDTTCDYTSAGLQTRDLTRNFKAAHPTTPVTAVPYSVCDLVWNGFGYVSAGNGTDIINKAAASLATRIGAGTSKVDVVTESFGGVVARQCLLNTYKDPADATYQPCRRIDDLIALVPPSHGTYAATLPAVTQATCTTWPTACKKLSSGPHLSTSNMCPIFLPTAQKVCTSLNPNAEYQKSIVQGAPGVPDETPGPTAYTVVYSYSDEFVFLNTTTGPGSPHPSPLAGATNWLATDETHTSAGGLTSFPNATGGGTHLGRARISGVSTLSQPFTIKIEEYNAGKPFCLDEIASGAVNLLDDTVTTAPTPLTTPIVATCT